MWVGIQERKHQDTTKLCSKPGCCGNPRRLKGQNELTIQEKRHADTEDS